MICLELLGEAEVSFSRKKIFVKSFMHLKHPNYQITGKHKISMCMGHKMSKYISCDS